MAAGGILAVRFHAASATSWDKTGHPHENRSRMKTARRNFLKLAAGAAALPALPGPSWALDYPARPVRVVVGFPPAGFTDTTTRLISAWLSDKLGQQFVVENRPGASSNIATEFV